MGEEGAEDLNCLAGLPTFLGFGECGGDSILLLLPPKRPCISDMVKVLKSKCESDSNDFLVFVFRIFSFPSMLIPISLKRFIHSGCADLPPEVLASTGGLGGL